MVNLMLHQMPSDFSQGRVIRERIVENIKVGNHEQGLSNISGVGRHGKQLKNFSILCHNNNKGNFKAI